MRGRGPFQHGECCTPPGSAPCLRDLSLEHHAMAMLHQDLPQIAQFGLLALRLPVQPRLGIGHRRVDGIHAPLARKLMLGLPGASGKSSIGAVGLRLDPSWLAQASIGVLSTVQCSSNNNWHT
jgi:hypothetical protein